MKTLKDHLLLYDEACLLCSGYAGTLVSFNMMDEKGRKSLQKIPENLVTRVDPQRAVNEIALANQRNGEVTYGVNSFFRIMEHSFPVLKPLFRLRFFAWPLDKLYKLISFNRRVILPSKDESSRQGPSFHLKYRLAFLVTAWVIITPILFEYSKLLTGYIPPSGWFREFLVCGGQMLWQLLFLFVTGSKRHWDYLGNMMTISLSGAIALIPMILISRITGSLPVFLLYFLLVAGLMFLEHIRRTKILKISPILTLTWVLYRVFILLIILITDHAQ